MKKINNTKRDYVIVEAKGLENTNLNGMIMVDTEGQFFKKTKSGLRKIHLYTDCYGYEIFDIRKNYERTIMKAHRIIAMTFIPNPLNLETVDHKNNCKTDNRVENLQWMTRVDNIKKYYKDKAEKEIEKIYRRRTIEEIDDEIEELWEKYN